MKVGLRARGDWLVGPVFCLEIYEGTYFFNFSFLFSNIASYISSLPPMIRRWLFFKIDFLLCSQRFLFCILYWFKTKKKVLKHLFTFNAYSWCKTLKDQAEHLPMQIYPGTRPVDTGHAGRMLVYFFNESLLWICKQLPIASLPIVSDLLN